MLRHQSVPAHGETALGKPTRPPATHEVRQPKCPVLGHFGLRISTLFLKENGVLQQQWLATTCFWAEVLGYEVVVGTLEKRLSHFARPSTYHGPIGSCPKTAKNRQNPSCDREMPKWGPKSVNTPKQPGSVQPSAWHSAHTC